MGRIKKKKKILHNNQCFINISNFSSKSFQKKKTSIISKKFYSSPAKTVSCKNPLKFKPIGISSFKGFIILSALNTSCGNISVIHHNSNKSVSFNITNNSESNSNLMSSLALPCPNILRPKRMNLKLNALSHSPMKALTFSPSKFLNRKETKELIEEQPESSNQVLFSSSTYNLEDSGIVLTESDIHCALPKMPLTSTPSSSSRQKFDQSFETQLDLEVCCDTSPLQSSPNTQLKQSTETPALHKFLKASVLRTPTPFKCNKSLSNQSDMVLSNSVHRPIEVTDTKSQVVTATLKVSPALHVTSSSSCKTGNLSVKSSQSNSFRRILFDQECKVEKSSFEFQKRMQLNNKPIFKKENASCFGKPITVTKKSKDQFKLTPLTSPWVNVACGQSFDQKVMTAAAKQCLHEL